IDRHVGRPDRDPCHGRIAQARKRGAYDFLALRSIASFSLSRLAVGTAPRLELFPQRERAATGPRVPTIVPVPYHKHAPRTQHTCGLRDERLEVQVVRDRLEGQDGVEALVRVRHRGNRTGADLYRVSVLL